MKPTARTMVVLCAAGTLVVLENQVLTVALPKMAASLDASNAELQWIVDAYVIVLAALLFPAGALQDRWGHRRFFNGGLAVFAAASVAAALSSTASQVIAARAAMGIGAAAMYPATLAILVRTFPDPDERRKAIALWAATTGVGVVLGPILGGVLVQTVSWQSVFVANVVIAAAVLLGSIMWVPGPDDLTGRRMDIAGMTLSGVALCAGVYALIEGPEVGWTATSEVFAAAVAVIAAACFVVTEHRTAEPMLPLDLFKVPGFRLGFVAQFFLFFLSFGTAFAGTLYIQVVQRHSPVTAGLMLLPFAVTVTAAAVLSPKMVRRYPNGTLPVGMAVLLVAMMSAAVMQPSWGNLPVLGLLGLLGVGYGLVSPQATDRIMESVPRGVSGVGGAVNNAVRQVGASFGIAIAGSVLASVYTSTVSPLITGMGLRPADQAQLTSSAVGVLSVEVPEPLRGTVNEAVNASVLNGVHAVFIGLSFAAAIGLIVAVWPALKPQRQAPADAVI